MAKRTKTQKKTDGIVKEEREKIMEILFGFSSKWISEIQDAFMSSVPCGYCDKDGHASKQDENGKCLKCHGLKVVSNERRREWAADQIGERIAPRPKPVEMTIEEDSSMEELQKRYQKETKEALLKKLALLQQTEIPIREVGNEDARTS
jgi:hypothetical protein